MYFLVLISVYKESESKKKNFYGGGGGGGGGGRRLGGRTRVSEFFNKEPP